MGGLGASLLSARIGVRPVEEHPTLVKTAIAAVGTVATYLWGGWDAVLLALVVLASLDYVSGVVAAWHRKELDSRVGARGIARKVGMFLVVAVCNIIDRTGGLGEPILRTATIWWYLGNEALSIVENLADIGVPIPTRILSALVSLKGKEEVRR